MISPLVATQASTPIASIQQNADAQSILHSQNALHETQEQEREVRETVVQKEEAAYYEQSPDAKEEGKNKYQNLYSGKKKKTKTENISVRNVMKVPATDPSMWAMRSHRMISRQNSKMVS